MKNKNETSGRLHRLKLRHTILLSLRDYFHAQGFLEIEVPILVKKTTPDTYIDSIQADGGYLTTSTEYQIKRLMAEGLEKVYTLTKNFRVHDRGRYHSPEFTMLEWGRAHASLQNIEEDTVQFIRKAFRALYPDQDSLNFNGNEINFMQGTWESLTVREAFEKHLGIKNLDDFSLKSLCKASNEAGIDLPLDFQSDRSLAISFLLDRLQSCLGKQTPTFLHEWPSYLTSSAPISSGDPHIAERCELYIGGIEIANGFPFLTNPHKQRELFEEQNLKRKELGKPIIDLDEKYIQALKDLPQGAGMALGVDRLVMILTQASQLSDVQAFDWDEL